MRISKEKLNGVTDEQIRQYLSENEVEIRLSYDTESQDWTALSRHCDSASPDAFQAIQGCLKYEVAVADEEVEEELSLTIKVTFPDWCLSVVRWLGLA